VRGPNHEPDEQPAGPDGWAISAVDLVKTYPTGRGKAPVTALDALSLRVRTGEVFGLLGPNGAGKSTAVKILTTLSRADGGTASVAGHDVRRDAERVRHAIGLVPQRPSAAPLMTGRESVELAGRIHGQSRREAARRAGELLDRFGLADAADRLTKTYSGGMARKLDVAIGLVNRPAVLFLDEPTTGLDPEARTEMWAEIGRMAGEERMTVLVTTHYLEEADHLADRLAIVDHGRVVVEGSPEDLKSRLQGDGVVVELTDLTAGPVALQRLSALGELRYVSLQGRELRARADAGARAVLAVLGTLDQAGVQVSAATVTRPSLDDVYLSHVGRTFEEATR
jgi:ABC-2 type transport system ATP-binding protein